MNPARSLAPGVLARDQVYRNVVWIYITAPFAAAIFTGLLLKWLAPNSNDKTDGEEKNANGDLDV